MQILMKSPTGSRVNFQDPIQIKLHLSNFSSSSSTSKSQFNPRKNESDDEIFCQLCSRLFKNKSFQAHLPEHRRVPKPKLPSLQQLYKNAHLSLHYQFASETIIQALDSKKNIEASEYLFSVPFQLNDFLSERHSFVPNSPTRERLKFTGPVPREYPQDQ